MTTKENEQQKENRNKCKKLVITTIGNNVHMYSFINILISYPLYIYCNKSIKKKSSLGQYIGIEFNMQPCVIYWNWNKKREIKYLKKYRDRYIGMYIFKCSISII